MDQTTPPEGRVERTRAQEICSRLMIKPYIPKSDFKDLVVDDELRRDVFPCRARPTAAGSWQALALPALLGAMHQGPAQRASRLPQAEQNPRPRIPTR